MRKVKSNKQKDLQVITLIFTLVGMISLTGFLYWSNFGHDSSPAKSEGFVRTTGLSDEEIETCKKRVAGENPQLEQDYSDCYTEIIPLVELSEQQKNENEENTKIINKARQQRNNTICDEIEGYYFQYYPPAMN